MLSGLSRTMAAAVILACAGALAWVAWGLAVQGPGWLALHYTPVEAPSPR